MGEGGVVHCPLGMKDSLRDRGGAPAATQTYGSTPVAAMIAGPTMTPAGEPLLLRVWSCTEPDAPALGRHAHPE
jgi:hypothetical protein